MVAVFRARREPSNALQPDEPDAALVAAALRDARAFSKLYHRYVGPIYRFCFVRLDNQQAAEDATSDIFLKALNNLPTFRGGTFPAWLFRIAHNVVVDAYRKQRPALTLDRAGEAASSDPSPEEQAIARSEAGRLRHAMNRLPGDQRLVLELDLAGWTGPQIADALGKSPGNVRVIRYRAMQRLRTLLDTTDAPPREQQP